MLLTGIVTRCRDFVCAILRNPVFECPLESDDFLQRVAQHLLSFRGKSPLIVGR